MRRRFHKCVKILEVRSGLIIPLSFGFFQIGRTFGKVFNCHRHPVTILAKAVTSVMFGKNPAHLE